LRKDEDTVKLEKTIVLEEVRWRQKLRALWLREGDKNTGIVEPLYIYTLICCQEKLLKKKAQK
jgi:hypothetical protein